MPDGRSIVIHGHFYQPPRQDPWLGEVETEPTAAPFHDWNERIEHECYRAVVSARIPGAGGRIARLVNTLLSISFDLGPTLATWMEREARDTYAAFLESDRVSRERLGFGNAIATPYHHVILPLCSRRDKVTEVRWGLRDFARRFGREADGIWLPEAAIDLETIDVLAEEGIRFTIVGPDQVKSVPAAGLPGRHPAASGKSIAIFVYDGPLSHDVAFGPLIQDANLWAERLTANSSRPQKLVSLATDGETFGHHHKFGEMALAAMLEHMKQRPEFTVENYSSFLSRNPPREDVAIVSPSSWSCPHGVERWRGNCGCKTAPQLPTQQAWRKPLRESLNWLADELHRLYAGEGVSFLGDVWAARDENDGDPFSEAGVRFPVRARELLELERNALAMFTSCGWFFDDVGGVENVVVLRHAARAIEMTGDHAARLEAGLLERLAPAKSNDPTVGDAAKLYRARVKSGLPAPERAAAGYRAVRLAVPGSPDAQLAGYELEDAGDAVRVTDRRTGRSYEARPATLPLQELPERHQAIVRGKLIREIAERRIGGKALMALPSGASDLAGLAHSVLSDAAGSLALDASEEAIARVSDLLDLLDLLGEGVSFETQARFYWARSGLPPNLVQRLAPLAARLGFVDP